MKHWIIPCTNNLLNHAWSVDGSIKSRNWLPAIDAVVVYWMLYYIFVLQLELILLVTKVFCFCLSRIFMGCFYLSQNVIINVWARVFICFKVRLHIFTDYPTTDLSFSNLHFLGVKMTAFSATYSARHDFILRLRYDHFLRSGMKLLRICWKFLSLSVGQPLSCFVFASISLNLGCRFCVFRIKHALCFLFVPLFNFYHFHRRRSGGSKV